MIHGFPELTVGGLLVAPFVPQAVIAFVIFASARPLRRRILTERAFANPPLAGICLYVVALALVMLVY